MSVDTWLCDICYTQQIISAEVMPAAVGSIATFCESQLPNINKVRLFKYPEKLIKALRERPPDIIGFSNYCWNYVLSYAFAQLVKHKYPHVVVVMGGPNYPNDVLSQEVFLHNSPAVDFYITKEGERPFTELVRALVTHAFDVDAVKALELGGVHAIANDGRFVAARPLARLPDLNAIPSPYITGKMDDFFDGSLMPIVQTKRGCPFTCTFCTEGIGYFNRIYSSSKAKIGAELDYIGRRMRDVRTAGGRNDLFIADSNFGMFKEDLETCEQLARTREQYAWPEYVKVGTGKNRKERVLEASRILDGALSLSGSVQSLDPVVLTNIKRANIDAEQLMSLAIEASEVGTNSYAEVILALPGDTKEKHVGTIETLVDAGFTNICMFQLMLLPGTELATPNAREQYRLQSHYRVLPRCFGDYSFEDERVICAEIEEIATSSDTLSFADYLFCRRLDLIVTIFYNDDLFRGLLKLLRRLGIQPFLWIRTLVDHDVNGPLGRMVERFVRETEGELWSSKEELFAFIRREENIGKYINDELGANLLYKYQSLATTAHIRELAEVAQDSVLSVIRESGGLTREVVAFVEDLVTYEVMRRVDIFNGGYDPRCTELCHDVERFLADESDARFSEYRFAGPRVYWFVLDGKQIDIIERCLNTYGRTTVGMTRILARVHIKSLLRRGFATGECDAFMRITNR